MSTEPVSVARQLFTDVWPSIEAACAGRPPALPRRLVWLNGAPGAGKGTNTRTIMQLMRIEAPPVVVSDLLATPAFVAIKNSGGLVGDRDVVGLLLLQLLEPRFADGAVIDGFPRSRPQAEFLRLLDERMRSLAAAHPGICPVPSQRIIVLNVNEEVAVERQLKRGREAVAANEQSRRLGGHVQEIRATDIDPGAAAKRYRVFQEQTVGALHSLTDAFPCSCIDAGADVESVARAIGRALA